MNSNETSRRYYTMIPATHTQNRLCSLKLDKLKISFEDVQVYYTHSLRSKTSFMDALIQPQHVSFHFIPCVIYRSCALRRTE